MEMEMEMKNKMMVESEEIRKRGGRRSGVLLIKTWIVVEG